ncbi:MAG TPA: 6-bladed beta-propeller [Bacteroidota bacterium]|nr:6-bladed beta-propeller [Bacteroidota bacterium]
MIRLSSLAFIVLSALIAGFLAGCSGSKESEMDSRLVWPGPPDTPRIAYVKSLKGEDDFSSGLGGVLNTIAGNKGDIKFQRPFDVCIADSGRIYLTDAMLGVIEYDMKRREVNPIGEFVGVDMKDPRGIAYAHGKVYVGVANLGQVIVIDGKGRGIGKIGRANQFPNPLDIVADTVRSRIYIVDNRRHQVFVYSEKGDSLFTIGHRGSGEGEFNFPESAAIDSHGNLFVVDVFNYRIEEFDTTGRYIRSFGKQGDAYGTFARPKGIAIDSHDNFYVLDGLHNNFQIFDSNFDLLMFVGHYSPNNDGFQNPVSIAIDRSNTIYVTDNLNQRIQVFQLLEDQTKK